MPTGKTRYCWDSCVFISLLTEAGRTSEELAHLLQLERLSDEGQITIFTSAITLVEVLSCKLTDEQEKAFKALLSRSNVLTVSFTRRIAETARELRNHYRIEGKELAVPDSIHIATAIQYQATALHTYDGSGKRPKAMDMLKLQCPLLGKYPLTICKPEPPPVDPSEAKGTENAASREHAVSMDLFTEAIEGTEEG